MTVTAMTETERKYEVEETTQVPDLGGLGRSTVEKPVTLRAVYFDTAEGALAARLVTLRRRTGGTDAGWHLKTPGTDGRTEHRLPLGASDTAPPDELVCLVRALVRDRPLGEVARVTTRRTVVNLLDAEGSPVVEIADDQVSATDIRTGILRIWREWEAELLDAAPSASGKRAKLLDAVEKVLLVAGATPARSASKLAQATGRSSLAPEHRLARSKFTRSSTSLEVVVAVIDQLTGSLLEADPRARADEDDAVHHLRTIVRRLRALLAAVEGVLAPDATDPVRSGLRRFGTILGGARDTQVRRDRAMSLLAETEDEASAENTDLRRRLVDDALVEYEARHAELLEYLDSAEYFALLDELDALAVRPPVAEASHERARPQLRSVLKKQTRRALRRLRKAARDGDIEALHHGRKATRQLRYVAEAFSGESAPVLGRKTRDLASAAGSVQNVIGDHRDALLFIERLDEVSREAIAAGEDVAGYGILAEAEGRNAAAALREVDKAIDALAAAARA